MFALLVPTAVYAQEVIMHEEHGHEGGVSTYIADHWHDIPLIVILSLAAIFAFRVAFLYGGIIGKGLNLVSVGILILTVSDVIGNFLLHLISAEDSLLHYVVDFLQIVGAGVIAFAFLRLHSETKQQFSLQEKK